MDDEKIKIKNILNYKRIEIKNATWSISKHKRNDCFPRMKGKNEENESNAQGKWDFLLRTLFEGKNARALRVPKGN